MSEDRNLFDSDKERSRKQLFRLIETSGVDSAEKELLKSLMGNLLEYQRGKFQAILSRYEEAARRPDTLPVVTGLMKKDARCPFPTLPVADNGAFFTGGYDSFLTETGFFQDVERHERLYEGRVGSGRFLYRLKRDRCLIEYERRLYRLACRYGIRNFVIYAPLFRRYARLEAVELTAGIDWKSVDFLLPENGLENKIRLCRDYVLFSNVGERNKTPDAVRETPGNLGNGQDLCFHFRTEPEEYVDLRQWPEFLRESDVEFIRTEGQTCIRVSGESISSPYALDFQSRTFERFPEAPDGMLFENRTGNIRPERIQSVADIEMALQALPGLSVERYFPGEKPTDAQLCQYEDDWAYLSGRSFSGGIGRNRYQIYVRFRNDGDAFLFDRIAFALSCLNTWYPECLWMGGYL